MARARTVFDALARRLDPEVARAVLRAVARTQSATVVATLEAALARGDLPAAVAAIPWDRVGVPRLQAEVAKHLASAAVQGAEATGLAAPVPTGVTLGFHLVEPRAVAWAGEHAARLVSQVSARTKEGIRAIVQRALAEGGSPVVQARSIRTLIGLTERGEAAVADYRGFLTRLAAADDLPRVTPALRARLARVGLRSGASLADASAARVRALVERYRDRLVKERALMIARTETLAAAHQGVQVAWETARDAGLLPPGQQRVWLVTDDERLCPDVCEPMDGVQVGLDEPWQVPGVGAVDVPQEAHPQCRCSMALVEA